MKKKIICFAILGVVLLLVNLGVYLAHIQFKCTEKIERGEDLNAYEIFSALQFHSCLWMFGWVVDPTTAQLCFLKQFHMSKPIFTFKIPEDSRLKKFKAEAKRTGRPVRMSWRKYTSQAALSLNGSYVIYDNSEGGPAYSYRIINDYKPGIINICGVTVSETVLGYLENKGYLLVADYYTICRD